MEEEEDRPSFIDIDLGSLEKEWVRQPALFLKYSKKLADAKLEADEKKAALDLAAAVLDKSIRDDPSAYDMKKATDASVKALIPTLNEYKRAQRRLSKARHRVDVLLAIVGALEHRKRALEKLVDLHGQEYFAVPRTSRKGMEEVVKREVRKKGRIEGG